MEEYTQITLDEWLQWKEDIRRKLEETADNFVYIGYRLKQIRDSGMYDGAADIFEFAEKEYGLGKSTVSRFIAINEKYSKDGNSTELKEEFRGFSSSKLSEMLTLPDNEIQLITEKTTIREIRELKTFNSQDLEEAEAAAGSTQAPDPLENCIIDYFRTRYELLNSVMSHLRAEPPEYKQAAEIMAPSGQASHKKGIVFLFMYDWNTGIKYKLMTEPDPINMSWQQFLNAIYIIFGACDQTDVWSGFYGKEEQEKEPEEKSAPIQSDQGSEPVATSQQKEGAPAELMTQEEPAKQHETVQETEDPQEIPVANEENGEKEPVETVQEEPENVEKTECEADPEETEDEDELLCDECKNASCLTGNPDLCANCGPDGTNYEKMGGSMAAEPEKTEEKYADRIEQLMDEAAKRADIISRALKTARNLGEYRRIKIRVNGLNDILADLIKYMDLAMPEKGEDDDE